MSTKKDQPTLNLARLHRPKTFEDVLGQDFSLKMLKNSLYKGVMFPVYLFHGVRGCGKTSTARIFAAALNCTDLTTFQKKPSHIIPCRACRSCKAMETLQHPDFIEMDAASHTGVDDVRSILESSEFLPILSSKKIYLIDETHMLSKAAFNALLKILEEPPSSALFILATTEIHKIPDTVRSRCFQVPFQTLAHKELVRYLKRLSKEENIVIDEQALACIVSESGGAVRDALNLLEKVRFLDEPVTLGVILSVLGKVREEHIYELFDYILAHDTSSLLALISELSKHNLNPNHLWLSMLQLLHTLIWKKYDVDDENMPFFDHERLDELAKKCTINRLQALMHLMYLQEERFLATPHKMLFLELVLIECARQVAYPDLEKLMETVKDQKPSDTTPTPRPQQKATPHIEKKDDDNIRNKYKKMWNHCVMDLEKKLDPFLFSVMKHATFDNFDVQNKKLTLIMHNHNPFLEENVETSKTIWLPLVQEHFSDATVIFKKPSDNNKPLTKKPQKAVDHDVDLQNKETWPKTNLVAQTLKTKITKIQKS